MAAEHALVGRTLGGRFRVTRLIGEGAMASVYQAEQEREPRDVAIKVMHPELAEDPTFMRRFRREAKAAACLRHPNVVQVIDYGDEGELAYIAMELVPGIDLFDLLVAEGRLSPARTARIMIQICDALQHAHDRGIVHRDLKPENVMILDERAPDGAERIKVLDFGIAKVRERERTDDLPSVSGSALTNMGAALGTPEYMSPEQCEGAEVDARSDVYTCGAVLYRVLVGRVPFCGAIALDTMLRHLRDPPTPPSAYLSDFPPGLEEVILKALAKPPAERQQSARQLAAELSALLPALDSAERSNPHPGSRKAPRKRLVSRALSPPRGGLKLSESVPSIDAAHADPDPPTDPDTTTSRRFAHGWRAGAEGSAEVKTDPDTNAQTDAWPADRPPPGSPESEVGEAAETAKFNRRQPPLKAPKSVPRPAFRAKAPSSRPPIDGRRREPPVDGVRREPPVDGARREEPVDRARREEPVDRARREEPVDGARREEPVDGARREEPVDGVLASQVIDERSDTIEEPPTIAQREMAKLARTIEEPSSDVVTLDASDTEVISAADTIVMARPFVDGNPLDVDDVARASVPSMPPPAAADALLARGSPGTPSLRDAMARPHRPVPVLRLFVLTFSIVLVLGIVLLRWAGEH